MKKKNYVLVYDIVYRFKCTSLSILGKYKVFKVASINYNLLN